MESAALLNNVGIVGCGDIGRRLSARLRARGGPPLGVVRSVRSAARLERAGLRAACLDLDHEPAPAAPLMFWLAPPPDTGERDTRLRRFLDSRPAALRRLVYLSTSGVYGDCAGRWIDEDEPLKPGTARARRRRDAEQAARAAAAEQGFALVILRVPGIYGPGRLPGARLRGMCVVREDQSPYSNRIHAEDLAEVALAAALHGRDGATYNVSDDAPTTMADYYRRCAALLGLPEPPTVGWAEAQRTFTPAALAFLQESKRLLNRRMKAELGVQLRYPELASGLPSCLEPSPTTTA